MKPTIEARDALKEQLLRFGLISNTEGHDHGIDVILEDVQKVYLEWFLEMIEGNKKSVLDMFPNADIKLPTEELAEKVIIKNYHNAALDSLKEEILKLKQ